MVDPPIVMGLPTKLPDRGLGSRRPSPRPARSSAPESAVLRNLETPICSTSGPSPEATAVVSFWSMLSHGTATTFTLVPVSSTKGATRLSKLVELSPMTHTVS